MAKEIEKKIAKDLLSIKAVFFRPEEPFIWASGIKSPVYCDNRLTLTAPEVRLDIEEGLAEVIREKLSRRSGAHGHGYSRHSSCCDHRPHPRTAHGLCTLRSKKDHGRKNQIEGRLEKGQKVVVIEDLISTGGSVIETVNVLERSRSRCPGSCQHIYLWHAERA